MRRRWALALLLAVFTSGGGQAWGQTPEEAVAIIREAAERHGTNGDRLVRVARCESSFNRFAIGRAGERGPFQLLPGGELRTFYARGYTDPHDWHQASDFAAARFAEGGAGAWSCR